MTTAPAATDALPARRDYYSLSRMLRYARGSDQAKAAAQAFIGKPLTNAETGIQAIVSKTSFGKILSKSAVDGSVSQQAHHQAAANLDILFELATCRLTRRDRKNTPDIKALHHFDAPMPFDGRVLRVGMLVKELTNPNQQTTLYTLYAVEIRKPPLPKIGDMVSMLPKGSSGSTSLGGYAARFAAMVAEVKRGMDDTLMTIAITDTETTHAAPAPQTENTPYARARALIDAAHAADPTHTEDGRAAELVYADRVEAWVARLVPDASPVLLLAARCQHLERFLTPRSTYPEGRAGYLKWRTFLYKKQAERARELALEAGLPEAQADQIARWVSKTDLRKDPGSQALEDAAILVFLENEIGAFAAQHADYPREKFVEILRKTWRKLSPAAQPHARALDLPPAIAKLVEAALGEE